MITMASLVVNENKIFTFFLSLLFLCYSLVCRYVYYVTRRGRFVTGNGHLVRISTNQHRMHFLCLLFLLFRTLDVNFSQFQIDRDFVCQSSDLLLLWFQSNINVATFNKRPFEIVRIFSLFSLHSFFFFALIAFRTYTRTSKICTRRLCETREILSRRWTCVRALSP